LPRCIDGESRSFREEAVRRASCDHDKRVSLQQKRLTWASHALARDRENCGDSLQSKLADELL